MTTGSVDPSASAEGIAIVGVGGRFPGASDTEALWQMARDGIAGITFFSDQELRRAGVSQETLERPDYVKAAGLLDGAELFDAGLFGYSPREAELLDPQHRLFLETAWHALEDAACDPHSYAGRIGVFAGCGFGHYLLRHVHPDPQVMELAGEYQALLANDKDFLATRLSYKLDLTGPSLTVQTACSTSLVAICLACQSLEIGDCDTALAGGVSLRLPQTEGYFYQAEGILSPDGHCRSFDAKAAGTVPGSGAGVVALKRLEDALEEGDPIRAVIRGWAVNNDGGRKAGYTAPRGEGQEEVILEALAMAQVHPETVGYVEAHGTGTHLGDPIEVLALSRAYRAHTEKRAFCALGSIKPQVGHLDDAAGVAGLIKTVMALEHSTIPPCLHFEAPNPRLELAESPFFVPSANQPWPETGSPRRAAVSSFGIGGTNAHVVLEQAPDPGSQAMPEEAPVSIAPARQLLVWSAACEASLANLTASLAEYLQQNPDTDLGKFAHTLRWGRRALPYRHCLVAETTDDARQALTHLKDHRVLVGVADAEDAPVAFLCPGQGSQFPGMAADLYAGEAAFRDALDECLDLFPSPLGLELRELLLCSRPANPQLAERLGATERAQPALFAHGYAAAALWRSRGLRPEALAGHSVGEWLAAHLAGVFRLEDAAALVVERGRLLAASPPGAMLSVALSAEDLEPFLEPPLALGAANGPNASTASGPADAIERLRAQLEAKEISHRLLPVTRAFHSPLVAEAAARLAAQVAAVGPSAPEIPLLSAVTGTWMTADEARDGDFWGRNLRQPVLFAAVAKELLRDPKRLVLDLGPGDTLATLTRQQPSARHRIVVAGSPHPREQRSAAAVDLEAAGRLWLAGASCGPEGFATSRQRLRLPPYPFHRQRYWIEAATPEKRTADRAVDGEILREVDPARWSYLPSWRRAAPTSTGKPSTGSPLLLACPGLEPPPSLLAAARHFDPEATVACDGPGFQRTTYGDPGVAGNGFGGPDFEEPTFEKPIFEKPTARDFQLSFREPSAWQNLISELRQEARLPSHFVLLAEAPGTPETASTPLWEQVPFFPLLHLIQALAHQVPSEEMVVTVVTTGAASVLGGDLGQSDQALLSGLARVIPQEHPNLLCRVVDLPTTAFGADSSTLPSSFSEEIFRGGREPFVALRGEHRWLPIFDRVSEPPDEVQLPFSDGPHVLITGGLGRFARVAARHFVQNHGARLTLIDHRNPQEASGEEESLAELEAEGSVVLLTADVTERSQVKEAVAAAMAQQGPIDAVLHAAGAGGLEAYATVAETRPELCREHFRPKIQGLLLLDEALGELQPESPPQLALVPTSLAPLLGGLGLGAYAATDAWVDAFAEAGAGHLPWRSVNWEGWEDLAQGPAGTSFGQQQNELMLRGQELAESLARALHHPGLSRLIFATGDLPKRLAKWTSRHGETPQRQHHGRRESSVPYEAPTTPEEEVIVAVWQQVLGFEPIGVEDDFFSLGGSSLVGLQIISRLRAELAVELPLRSFFEARTPRALALELVREKHRKDEEQKRMEAILAEIEALSGAEVEQYLEAEAALPAGQENALAGPVDGRER